MNRITLYTFNLERCINQPHAQAKKHLLCVSYTSLGSSSSQLHHRILDFIFQAAGCRCSLSHLQRGHCPQRPQRPQRPYHPHHLLQLPAINCSCLYHYPSHFSLPLPSTLLQSSQLLRKVQAFMSQRLNQKLSRSKTSQETRRGGDKITKNKSAEQYKRKAERL